VLILFLLTVIMTVIVSYKYFEAKNSFEKAVGVTSLILLTATLFNLMFG